MPCPYKLVLAKNGEFSENETKEAIERGSFLEIGDLQRPSWSDCFLVVRQEEDLILDKNWEAFLNLLVDSAF